MYEEQKQKLINAAIMAEDSGLCRHGSGNFSFFDRKTGIGVITPSGIARNELKIDDIPVFDISGNIVENINGKKPSSELGMHISAYKTREDINAVAHTHSHFATSFAVRGKEIKPVVFEAFFYGGKMALCDYHIPGSNELAEAVKNPLMIADVCMLKSHGILVVGMGMDETVEKAIYVEDVARIYYYALTLGDGELDTIPESDFETYKRSKTRTL